MELVISALVGNILISLVIPLVIGIVLWIKHPMERKGILLLAMTGILSYIGMQWGIKEHVLAYLFNHTQFQKFMDAHYIPYLLVVALAGALLALIPALFVAIIFCRRQISFRKSVVWGLAYGATESVFLVGYKSFCTIVEWTRDRNQEISATAGELFLSGYERILMMFIEIAIITAFIYFVEQKMTVRGAVIQVVCHTFITFLPGFFIAFSMTNYYEVFDRSTTLVFVYIVLTVAAVCAVAILNVLKYSMNDRTVDSKEAIEDYEIRLQVRRDMKASKKQAKKNRKLRLESNGTEDNNVE